MSEIKLSEEQENIINCNNSHLFVNAVSGSGKTSTLIYLRYLNKANGLYVEEEGIIPLMCNANKVFERFDKIIVTAIEIYVNYEEEDNGKYINDMSQILDNKHSFP